MDRDLGSTIQHIRETEFSNLNLERHLGLVSEIGGKLILVAVHQIIID